MNDENKNLQSGASAEELERAIARLESKLQSMDSRLSSCDTSMSKMGGKMGVFKKKLLVTAIATGVAATSFALSTYSYFIDSTFASGNQIHTGYASVELMNVTDSLPGDPDAPIKIMPGCVVEKSVSAKSTGSYPLYVRIRLESAITLDERYAEHASEIDLSLVSFDIDRENWIEKDGYYYYKEALKQNETTPELMTEIQFSKEMGNIYKDSTITVHVRLEVVQANNNGDTVFDAVGWTTPEEGGVA